MPEPEGPKMAIWRRIACWISNATRPQAHTSARAPTPTQTHTRTRTRSPHTQKYVILLFYGNNGFVHAPQCTLPLCFETASDKMLLILVSMFTV